MADDKKPPGQKIVATSVAASPIGAVAAWAWNGVSPDYPMTPEVAAAMSPLLGAALAYLASWLPKP